MDDLKVRALALFDELADLDPAAQSLRIEAMRSVDAALATELEHLLAADAMGSGVVDRGLGGVAASLANAIAGQNTQDSTQPKVMGSFLLDRVLGRGGMGEVWLAHRVDGDFRQQVALKVCRRGLDGSEMRRRFVQERRILAELSHPGIARFIDGGVSEDGTPWYAMEYVEGQMLTEYARLHHLEVRERVRLIAEVAEAVAYAQARLVVHRDLKPSNILVDDEGRVHLLDFGIAKLLGEGQNNAETATGMRALSPAYAAPEQILDQPISTATDVFALGMVLHEMLTGARPVERAAGNLLSLPDAARQEITQKPSARLRLADATAPAALGASQQDMPRFARALKGELDTIVLMALRREPERRYRSAAAMADDLRRWLNGRPVSAQPDTASYRLRKFVARHRVAVVAVGAVLLALIGGFGAAVWQARVAVEAAKRADAEAASSDLISEFALTMMREQYAYGRDSTKARTPAELLAASVETARSTLKDDDRARAVILGKLGELLSTMGSPALAESPVMESLDLTRRIYPATDPRVGHALVAAATMKEQSGQLPAAEEMLREALPIYLAAPNQERSVAMTRSRLASILRRTGRVDEAIAELDAARKSAEVGYGVDHPTTIELIGNGAMLLEQTDRLAEAEAAYREAVAAFERIDRNFPRLANPLFYLGNLLGRTGHYDEARATMRRALQIGESTVGKHDPHRSVLVMQYAEFLRGLGEAEAARQASDAIDIVMFDERPLQRSQLLRLRAQIAADEGRNVEAQNLFVEAGTALEKSSGSLKEARISLLLAQADFSIATGDRVAARQIVEAAHAAADTSAPLATSIRIELARMDAQLALQQGDAKGAASLLGSAMKQQSEYAGEETIEYARLEYDLASALSGIPDESGQAKVTRESGSARLARLRAKPPWLRLT